MIELLSLRGFARRRGLAPGTVRRYHAEGRLPPPDGQLTDGAGIRHVGWFPESVDNWQRPGQGSRTDLKHRHDEIAGVTKNG
ncbi:MAG: hypothetical protein PHQ28_00700 [Mycobacterium sp.]|nr:hypothetical protein [Mycobacterium sp.]